MRISFLNSINNYSKVISDYKNVRTRLVPEYSKIDCNRNIFELKTQRNVDDITQFVIDAKLKNIPEICNEGFEKEELIRLNNSHTAYLHKLSKLDRIEYVIQKLKKGEYISTTTMAGLSILYGPEDLYEVGSAYKQIKKNVYVMGLNESENVNGAKFLYSFWQGNVLQNILNSLKIKKEDFKSLTVDKKLVAHVKDRVPLEDFTIGYYNNDLETINDVIDCENIFASKVNITAEKVFSTSNIDYLSARKGMDFRSVGTLGSLTITSYRA